MGAAETKAGHDEEYVDGTSAAPWPQLDGVRPKTSPALVDDRRSEDGEGRGGAKYDTPIVLKKLGWTVWITGRRGEIQDDVQDGRHNIKSSTTPQEMGQRNSYGDFGGFEGQRIQLNHVFGYQHIC